MSDLTIDLANYIVEQEPGIDFDAAQDMVLCMDEDSIGALMEEAGL